MSSLDAHTCACKPSAYIHPSKPTPICLYTHTQTQTHTDTHTYIYTRVRTGPVPKPICLHPHLLACTHTQPQPHLVACTHTHNHSHTLLLVHKRSHIHKHTNGHLTTRRTHADKAEHNIGHTCLSQYPPLLRAAGAEWCSESWRTRRVRRRQEGKHQLRSPCAKHVFACVCVELYVCACVYAGFNSCNLIPETCEHVRVCIALGINVLG